MSVRPHALLALLAIVVALVGPVSAETAAAAGNRDELPLGRPSLPETRTTTTLAAGVTRTHVERGFASKRDGHVVDVAFAATRQDARTTVRALRGAGYDGRVERVKQRAADDSRRGPLGYLVRSGPVGEQAAADERRAALVAAGFAEARTVYTGEDGGRTTGPWIVDVLEVDPGAFAGDVTPALATGIVPGRETLTSLAGPFGALAGVNGGYFVIGASNGTDGDLAGISVLDGQLVSEAIDRRTSLVLPTRSGEGARVEALRTDGAVRSSDGARRELDGLNRVPGLIRNCGGVGGDQPTQAPLHDVTCTDPSELIRYDSRFGASTDAGPGVEAVLGPDGTVTERREARGGAIPARGAVLAGTGDGADWLRSHARVGRHVAVPVTASGRRGPLPLGSELGVVNGGPRLLRRGVSDVNARAEGFDHPGDPEFFYRFGVRRNPRTLAGVTPAGNLLLVTVDGRRPGYSVGASFEEEAEIVRALGARDALNLDGGGSTTMVARGQLVNRPSDSTGERPIGDAILLEP